MKTLLITPILLALVFSCGKDNETSPYLGTTGSDALTSEVELNSQKARNIIKGDPEVVGIAICKEIVPKVLAYHQGTNTYRMYKYIGGNKVRPSYQYLCNSVAFNRTIRSQTLFKARVNHDNVLKAKTVQTRSCKTKRIFDPKTKKIIGYESFKKRSTLVWDKQKELITVGHNQKVYRKIRQTENLLRTHKSISILKNCQRF